MWGDLEGNEKEWFYKRNTTQLQGILNRFLPLKLVDHLFDKFREDFNRILKLQNSKHFFDLFDQDNDGYLSYIHNI